MPRDTNGNYTLPAGNPVASSTIISSTWANPTMDDLAAEVTNSLDRNGRGGMLVPFLNQDGTVIAPGISFTNEPSSGLWRALTNDVRMAIGADDTTRWIDANAQPAGSQNPFQIWNGSAWANALYAGGSGLPILPNDTYLQGRNFADDGNVDLIKANASDEVEIGAPTRLNGLLTVASAVTGDDVLRLIAKGVDGANLIQFQREDGAVGGVLSYDGASGAIALITTSFHSVELGSHGVTALRVSPTTSDIELPNGSLTIINTDPVLQIRPAIDGQNSLIFFQNSAGSNRAAIDVVVDGLTSTMKLRTGAFISALEINTDQDVLIPNGGLSITAGAFTVSGGIHSGGTPTAGRIQLTDQAVVMGMQVNAGVASFQSNTNTTVQIAVGGVANVSCASGGDVSIPNGNLTVSAGIIDATGGANAIHKFESASGFGAIFISSGDANGTSYIFMGDASGEDARIAANSDKLTMQVGLGAEKILELGSVQSEIKGPFFISDVIGNTRFSIDFAGGVFMNNTDNSTVNFQTQAVTAISYDNAANVSIPNGNLTVADTLTVSGNNGIRATNGAVLAGVGIQSTDVGARIDQNGGLITNQSTDLQSIRVRLLGTDNFIVTAAGTVTASGDITAFA